MPYTPNTWVDAPLGATVATAPANSIPTAAKLTNIEAGIDALDAWRYALPSRNIVDAIDVVASDHTAAVKQAYVDYDHWHNPGVELRLDVAPWDTNACIVMRENASLTGVNNTDSTIQLLSDSGGTALVDILASVFRLAGPNPNQIIRDIGVTGTHVGNMTWTNGARNVFYENVNGVGGAASVRRPSRVLFQRVRFQQMSHFAIHSEFAPMTVDDCLFIDLGNSGANSNGTGFVFQNNLIVRAEGCENAGRAPRILNNDLYDCLNTGIAIGGQFGAPPLPDYSAGLVFGNRVYGSTGSGILVAEHMSDTEIIGNYVQQTAGAGIQLALAGTRLTNGTLVMGNHLASCQTGILVSHPNVTLRDNRIYQHANYAAPAMGIGINVDSFGVDCTLDGNRVEGATSNNVTLSATGIRWGPTNRIGAPAGAGTKFLFGGAMSFEDARYLNYDSRTITGANPVALLDTDRKLYLDASGANRTIFLMSAVGKKGMRVGFDKVDATFTHTLDPFGAQTIDGAATKVMAVGSKYEVESDGTNWRSVSQIGTVT